MVTRSRTEEEYDEYRELINKDNVKWFIDKLGLDKPYEILEREGNAKVEYPYRLKYIISNLNTSQIDNIVFLSDSKSIEKSVDDVFLLTDVPDVSTNPYVGDDEKLLSLINSVLGVGSLIENSPTSVLIDVSLNNMSCYIRDMLRIKRLLRARDVRFYTSKSYEDDGKLYCQVLWGN